MTYKNPWLYRGKEFDSEDIEQYAGFVYRITNTLNGKAYIGKKLFQHRRRIKRANRARREIRVKESSWKVYYGSNKALLEDVELHGEDKFRREILHLCESKAEASYFEAKHQFEEDVLFKPDLFYNSWISVRLNGNTLTKRRIK